MTSRRHGSPEAVLRPDLAGCGLLDERRKRSVVSPNLPPNLPSHVEIVSGAFGA